MVAAFPTATGIHFDSLLGGQAAGAAAQTITHRNVVLTPLTAVGT